MSIAVGILVGTVTSAAGVLVAGEAKGWANHIQRTLLDSTLKKLPEDARERYGEELAALMESYADRPITGTLQAVSLRLNRGALARECKPRVPELNGGGRALTARVAKRAGHAVGEATVAILDVGVDFLAGCLFAVVLVGPPVALLFMDHVL